MVGLRITLFLCILALACSCSRAIRNASVQCQFSGQRGRYDYVLSLRLAPGSQLQDCSVAAYTTWPRPNLPYDEEELHAVVLRWEPEAQPGCRQARFSTAPPVKDLLLVYQSGTDQLRTYRITAPKPAVELQRPEMY